MSMVEEDLMDLDDDNDDAESGPRSSRRRGKGARKVQFRWNYEKDLVLVKEVDNLKPFLEPSRRSGKVWGDVVTAVNSVFKGNATCSPLGAQRRFDLLLKDFKKEDFQERYKSGTEEDVTEIKTRLANIQSLIEDNRLVEEEKSTAVKKKSENEKIAADEIRAAAATTFEKKEKPAPVKKIADHTLVELWQEKQVTEQKKLSLEQDMKTKEMELKEDELKFRKEQFEHQKKKEEFEMKMQEQKMLLEAEERKAQINTQKAMLELLLKMKN